jgi:hypothetical protein
MEPSSLGVTHETKNLLNRIGTLGLVRANGRIEHFLSLFSVEHFLVDLRKISRSWTKKLFVSRPMNSENSSVFLL